MIGRFSEYRIMWVLVLFDLPTETKKDKKAMLISERICKRMDSPCSNSPSMSATALVVKMQMFISGALSLSCQTMAK